MDALGCAVSWIQGIVEVVKAVCLAVVVIVFIIAILDVEITFYPPKDGGKKK
jgi:hypothetical protein